MAVIVATAMATDALDGYLARRWNTTSEIGYVLDAMGDRALHLALVLIILVRYNFHPIIVWLLIFRDIGIYAVRVLTPTWLAQSRQLRWISVLHATNVRIWLAMFLIRDGVRIFTARDLLDTFVFEFTQTLLISSTIVFAYCGLFRSFRWLVEIDHRLT